MLIAALSTLLLAFSLPSFTIIVSSSIFIFCCHRSSSDPHLISSSLTTCSTAVYPAPSPSPHPVAAIPTPLATVATPPCPPRTPTTANRECTARPRVVHRRRHLVARPPPPCPPTDPPVSRCTTSRRDVGRTLRAVDAPPKSTMIDCLDINIHSKRHS